MDHFKDLLWQGSKTKQWQIKGYERGKDLKDTSMSLTGEREGKNIIISSSHSRRVQNKQELKATQVTQIFNPERI